MNVNDYEAPETPADWPTALGAIFNRQRELMEKYKTIEGLPEPPLSLHHASGQRVLKDFAWRVTEELTESWEAWEKSEAIHGGGPEDDLDALISTHLQHQYEELADAWHFFVELLIFAGVGITSCLGHYPHPPTKLPIDRKLGRSDIEHAYWAVVYELGLAMNFLRNKPWKQSQVPTDEGRFRAQLLRTYRALTDLTADVGLSWEEVFAFYFRKSEVNRFRQRSQY